MRGKKAQLFSISLLIILIIILSVTYTTVQSTQSQFKFKLGDLQFNVLKTHLLGEGSLFFVDQSAKYAASLAVKDLSNDSSNCGTYLGYSVWSNATIKDCSPTQDDIQNKFKQFYNDEFNKFANKYTRAYIPQDNYEIELISSKITEQDNTQTETQTIQKQFIWPINYPFVTSCYGSRIFDGQLQMHDGVDLRAPEGTDIEVVADGVVNKICNEWVGPCSCTIVADVSGSCQNKDVCAGKCGNYGNYIIVKHSDNSFTRYNHLSQILVNEGDVVKQSDVIAKSGNTGLSEAPHLDFKYYDSASFGKDQAEDPFCLFPLLSDSQFKLGACGASPYKICNLPKSTEVPRGQTKIIGNAKSPISVALGGASTVSAEQIDKFYASWGTNPKSEFPSIMEGIGQCMIDAEARTQIPAAILVAISGVESTFGTRGLLVGHSKQTCVDENGNPTAVNPNNPFSISAIKSGGSYVGASAGVCYAGTVRECVQEGKEEDAKATSCVPDSECNPGFHTCTVPNRAFKSYANVCDAVNDLVKVLKYPRYWDGTGGSTCQPIKNYLDNPAEMLKYIQQCGYIPSPKWAKDAETMYIMFTKEVGAGQGTNSLSSYSIIPNFKSVMDYAFDEYEEIKKYLPLISEQAAQQCYKPGTEISGCMYSILRQIDSTWIYECDKSNQAEAAKNKKQLRICKKSKYNFTNEKGEQESYMYKISFFTGDTVPPEKVKDVVISDTREAEQNITINFTANKEQDIDHYNIYYSESSSIDITKKESLLGNVTHDASKVNYSTTFKLPKDEQTYYFAVTAIDTSSNEGQFDIKQGKSEDDLKPGPVTITGATRRDAGPTPVYIISLLPLTSNTDGSFLVDLQNYDYYLKKKTGPLCLEGNIYDILLTGVKSTTGISLLTQSASVQLPDETNKYCVVVIAQDENPQSGFEVSQKQYSQYSIIELP